METSSSTEGRSASELIDERIAELADWRGETLRRMRELVKEADPEVVEEMDVRPGGAYRFRTAFGLVEGEFHEVEPPERLVQTFQNHLQTLRFAGEDRGLRSAAQPVWSARRTRRSSSRRRARVRLRWASYVPASHASVSV